MRCAFLLNARPMTLDPDFYAGSRAGGYLFPPEAATEATVRQLAEGYRRFVVADNGAFDDIGRIASAVPAADSADGWARARVELAARARAVDTQSRLPTQLSVRPDAVVGGEDITVAVWLRAGIPEEALRRQRRAIAARNEAAARRGVELTRTLDGPAVLTVASAHDYDTAHDAGRRFADAGVRSAAIGFGAFMADDQWTAVAKVRGRLRKLPRSLPCRYLRTALVARGFFDGWAATGAGAPDHFHFLGLGAPIMVPVAALPAAATRLITFDATSPIKDATSGSMYVTAPAPLTVRTWKVAERIASGERSWTCPCRFCATFTAQHPFDQPRAAAVRGATSAAFTSADLRPGAALATAVPLFRTAPDPVGRSAERARIGHNHWVLSTLARTLTERSADLEGFVGERVARYEANAGAPHFAEAVRLAYDIARSDADILA